MQEEITAKELVEAFGLRSIESTSLTRFARVYRAVTSEGAPVVVKRTPASGDDPAALFRWTDVLVDAGLAVVSPIRLETPNPQILGGEYWVVYPWISGDPYAGVPEQIRAAGDLLGRMHAAEVRTAGMRAYRYPETQWADVVSDCDALEEILAGRGGTAAVPTVRELGRRWWEESLPALIDRNAELPRTAVSSDYKANNLVYTEDDPVLVDPDNGGVEPRLFDLALAVVLFHNEAEYGPARMFTTGEWETFRDAYLKHVTLTAAERELWPAALDHMLWEEGTWVIESEDAESWADPRQHGFLLSLAQTAPEDYRF